MWPFTSERDELKGLIAGFAPEEVINRLFNGRLASLTPAKREVTIFFSDVGGVTNHLETLDLDALYGYLTEFHTGIDRCIRNNRGVVDKVNGDSVMALWNAPEDCPNHPLSACLAALESQDAVTRLGARVGMPSLHLRIGINSGDVVAGLFQFGTRRHYTAFGDEVTIASRLEGVNKFFGTRILVSEDVYRQAGSEIVGRPVGQVRMPGRENSMRLFELLARNGALQAAWAAALPIFVKALDCFYARRFEDAWSGFDQVLKHLPEDGPSKLFSRAAEDYTQRPPPEDWDGVFNITSQ